MKLILIRHGQPMTGEGAPECDPPLTPCGEKQAAEAAVALQSFTPNLLISSGMRRADQTAAASARHLGLEVMVDSRFAEVDYGGHPYVDGHMMKARGPQAWEAFLRDPVGTMGGDEAKMTTRLHAAISDLFDKYKHTKQVIAIFCHAFPIGLIVTSALGAPAGPRLTRYLPAFCSFTRLVGSSPTQLAMQAFGEAQHVAPYPPLT